MAEMSFRRACAYLLVAAAVGSGCGGASDGETEPAATKSEARVLGATEAKQVLRDLPYRYAFKSVAKPEGAQAAVSGRAIGPHHTVLNFGIALGHDTTGVPVAGVGTAESYGYPRGGFVFTTDTFVRGSDGKLVRGPQFKTDAQWREVSHMEVMMTDKLCRAATGEPCPI